MNNQTKNIKKKIFLACPLFKPEANKGKIAILQIMILLIGVVAFSYFVGGLTPAQEAWADSIAERGNPPPAGGLVPWSERTGSSSLSKVFNVVKGGGWDVALSAVQWAVVTYFIIKSLGSTLGLDKGETDALAASIGIGVGTWKGLTTAGKLSAKAIGWTGFGVTVVLLILWPAKGDKYVYSCKMWDAPVGGRDCHLCNNQRQVMELIFPAVNINARV